MFKYFCIDIGLAVMNNIHCQDLGPLFCGITLVSLKFKTFRLIKDVRVSSWDMDELGIIMGDAHI